MVSGVLQTASGVPPNLEEPPSQLPIRRRILIFLIKTTGTIIVGLVIGRIFYSTQRANVLIPLIDFKEPPIISPELLSPLTRSMFNSMPV